MWDFQLHSKSLMWFCSGFYTFPWEIKTPLKKIQKEYVNIKHLQTIDKKIRIKHWYFDEETKNDKFNHTNVGLTYITV